jgi:GT2 family glycosyltransferase
MTGDAQIGAVVIGRNEGGRLVRCLTSLQGQAQSLIYVDSGSTDDSVKAARALGAEVVDLETDKPFTAARARNAGFEHLIRTAENIAYVQFVDGDCKVDPDWIETARRFLETTPKAAVACGRRRERFPEASIYNRLIDEEWDTPIGQAKACGGDALMRCDAVQKVGGFNPDLIAGEEPELCVRLRQAGWSIWRLDAEMTLHDAALMRFGQWWNRIRRGGHAFAEGAALHGAPPERHFVRETRRALIWGAVLPLVLLGSSLVTPWAAVGFAIWPAQILRLRKRGESWEDALFLTLSKFPEALGALSYYWRRLVGGRIALIEYK